MVGLREIYWRLRYELRPHYLIPVVLLLLLVALLSRDPFSSNTEAGEAVVAEITSMEVGWNKYQGATPGLRVRATTAKGAVGSTIAIPAAVRGCKVGDPIRAEQKGLKLYLYPQACAD